MLHIDEVRKELLNDISLDLTQIAIAQRDGRSLTEKEEQSIMTLALVITECFAPILYKLRKIQLSKPNFVARRIMLSPLAYERFRKLLQKKLVTNDGNCMGMRYNKSSRVSNDIYCRIIGDMGG